MQVNVQIIHAFTDVSEEGNPAAVIFDQPHLNADQKQEIARVVNLSETVFIDHAGEKDVDFVAEFFTPTRQIDNCGHATIAAFSHINEVTNRSFQTFRMGFANSKRKPQNIEIRGNQVFLELPAQSFNQDARALLPIEEKEVFQALGMKVYNADPNHDMRICSLGNPFFFVPLKSNNQLAELKPDFQKLAELSKRLGVIGFYPYARETLVKNRDAAARMFAPAYNINEEAATGMAAACLAAHMYADQHLHKDEFLIEQGWHMNGVFPSLLRAQIKKSPFGNIRSVLIGGRTIHRDQQTITL